MEEDKIEYSYFDELLKNSIKAKILAAEENLKSIYEEKEDTSKDSNDDLKE